MLKWFLLILACQFAGEVIVQVVHISFPGPVLGMVLLLGLLVVWGDLPEDLEKAGDALLSNLSLLFVPAGVGIMGSAGILKANLLPLGAAIVCSSLLTIAVTAATMARLNRGRRKNCHASPQTANDAGAND